MKNGQKTQIYYYENLHGFLLLGYSFSRIILKLELYNNLWKFSNLWCKLTFVYHCIVWTMFSYRKITFSMSMARYLRFGTGQRIARGWVLGAGVFSMIIVWNIIFLDLKMTISWMRIIQWLPRRGGHLTIREECWNLQRQGSVSSFQPVPSQREYNRKSTSKSAVIIIYFLH